MIETVFCLPQSLDLSPILLEHEPVPSLGFRLDGLWAPRRIGYFGCDGGGRGPVEMAFVVGEQPPVPIARAVRTRFPRLAVVLSVRSNGDGRPIDERVGSGRGAFPGQLPVPAARLGRIRFAAVGCCCCFRGRHRSGVSRHTPVPTVVVFVLVVIGAHCAF